MASEIERTTLRVTMPVLATFETTVDTEALCHSADLSLKEIKELSPAQLGGLYSNFERYLRPEPLTYIISVTNEALGKVVPCTAQIKKEDGIR